MVQGLTFSKQYPIIMGTFATVTIEGDLQWNKNNEAHPYGEIDNATLCVLGSRSYHSFNTPTHWPLIPTSDWEKKGWMIVMTILMEYKDMQDGFLTQAARRVARQATIFFQTTSFGALKIIIKTTSGFTCWRQV